MELRPKPKQGWPKTPLLLGGVFGIGLLAWFALTHKAVALPYDALPKETVAAVTVFGTGEDRQETLTRFTQATSTTLPTGMDTHSNVTFYAVREGDGLSWRVVETKPTLNPSMLDVVPSNDEGVGFGIGADGRRLPISLDIDENRVLARIGYAPRGYLKEPRALDRGPSLASQLSDKARMYVSMRSPAQDGLVPDLGRLSGLVGSLQGPTEIMLGQSEPTIPLQHFLIRTIFTNPTEAHRIDSALKDILGRADPHKDALQLEDQSSMTELRLSTSAVKLDERAISTGTIKRFVSPYGRASITVFTDHAGTAWISDQSATLQGFITALSSETSERADECIPMAPALSTLLYPQNIDAYTHPLNNWKSLLTLFERVSFSVVDTESGLFTVCGYL